MSLGSWLWGTTQVDEAIDKATSELMPVGTEDIALNLEISDQIRAKSVPPKDAMRALKRRLNHKNPNVQILALDLTDTCIKNGGDHFLVEVASREFMDNLVSILKIPILNHEVKQRILRLVQNWATSFEGKPNLNYVGQVYKTLKQEGFTFPPQDLAATSSAMVDTQTAPEWIDSDVCLRCRTPFSFTNRKHHCRNCGQVFDQQCSSKVLALPHFGIAQEVRVCDGCHVKLTKPKREKSEDPKHRRHASTRHRSARELADAELQRAIQLSLEEVGASGRNRPGYVPSQPKPSAWGWSSSEPPIVDHSTSTRAAADDEDDPDLKAAIEASLREANAPRPSAPIAVETPRAEAPTFSYAQQQGVPMGMSQSYPPATPAHPHPAASATPSYDLQPLEADVIMTFSQTVEEVQAQGGRDISRYPGVNELYDKANGLKPKLALSLDDTDRKQRTLSDMHAKLSQAVKLYDQLLTEQISRPTHAWGMSPQQVQPGLNRYNSYAGPVPAPMQSPPVSVLAAQQNSAMQYAPVPQQQNGPLPNGVPYAPVRQQSYAEAPTPASTAQFVQPPPPILQQQQYVPPPPQASSLPRYQQPPQHAMSPPPEKAYTHPQSAPFAPTTQVHAPLPIQTAAPPAPVPDAASTSLSRSNTLMTPPYVPSTPAVANYGYSSPGPMASTSTPSAASAQYAQPVQSTPYTPTQSFVPTPAPAAAQPQSQPQLPQFPVVPSSNPQTFPLYGSSIPASGVEQSDKQEALLIDL